MRHSASFETDIQSGLAADDRQSRQRKVSQYRIWRLWRRVVYLAKLQPAKLAVKHYYYLRFNRRVDNTAANIHFNLEHMKIVTDLAPLRLCYVTQQVALRDIGTS